jgi:hypothetical protein
VSKGQQPKRSALFQIALVILGIARGSPLLGIRSFTPLKLMADSYKKEVDSGTVADRSDEALSD